MKSMSTSKPSRTFMMNLKGRFELSRFRTKFVVNGSVERNV